VVGILRTFPSFTGLLFKLLSLRIDAFRHFVLLAAVHVYYPLPCELGCHTLIRRLKPRANLLGRDRRLGRSLQADACGVSRSH
jgi:hypothetical protein